MATVPQKPAVGAAHCGSLARLLFDFLNSARPLVVNPVQHGVPRWPRPGRIDAVHKSLDRHAGIHIIGSCCNAAKVPGLNSMRSWNGKETQPQPLNLDRRLTMNYATPEQFAAANKANVETALTLAKTVFASAERLAALNLNTARGGLEDAAVSAKTVLGAKDIQAFAGLTTSLGQPIIEKAVAYSRNVYEIVSQTQAEVSKLVEAQFADLSRNVAAVLENVAKNGPAGSDVAVSVVKSAIASANSAYDGLNKAVKQVADIAVANIAAATDATVKAAGATAPKLKKVA